MIHSNTLKSIFFIPLILLSACVHKSDVEQGNIVTPKQISQLHQGMTDTEVTALLGDPQLHIPFNQNRMEYVYTFQKGHDIGVGKNVSLLFKNHLLVKINNTPSFSLPR